MTLIEREELIDGIFSAVRADKIAGYIRDTSHYHPMTDWGGACICGMACGPNVFYWHVHGLSDAELQEHAALLLMREGSLS